MAASDGVSVVFACNLNRVRSPMAAAILRRLRGGVVQSCGVYADDADEPDPFAAQVMAEAGFELGRESRRKLSDLDLQAFDLVITLTPEARASAQAQAGRLAIEHWPIDDPTLAFGSRATILEAYRAIRDALVARVEKRFGAESTR
ncbi:MAG TPA: low molecular weight phosphatase family protein [Caulobacteraceae bacterium]|nr:low molecular weight phosphatase family protein [Caulobacteraceae bacterium]